MLIATALRTIFGSSSSSPAARLRCKCCAPWWHPLDAALACAAGLNCCTEMWQASLAGTTTLSRTLPRVLTPITIGFYWPESIAVSHARHRRRRAASAGRHWTAPIRWRWRRSTCSSPSWAARPASWACACWQPAASTSAAASGRRCSESSCVLASLAQPSSSCQNWLRCQP